MQDCSIYNSFYLPQELRQIRNAINELLVLDLKVQQTANPILSSSGEQIFEAVKSCNQKILAYDVSQKKKVTLAIFQDLCKAYMEALENIQKKIDDSSNAIEESRQLIEQRQAEMLSSLKTPTSWLSLQRISSATKPLLKTSRGTLRALKERALLSTAALMGLAWKTACPSVMNYLEYQDEGICPESASPLPALSTCVVTGIGFIALLMAVKHLMGESDSVEEALISPEEMHLLEEIFDSFLEKTPHDDPSNLIFKVEKHEKLNSPAVSWERDFQRTGKNLNLLLLSRKSIEKVKNPDTKSSVAALLAHELAHLLNKDTKGEGYHLLGSILASLFITSGAIPEVPQGLGCLLAVDNKALASKSTYADLALLLCAGSYPSLTAIALSYHLFKRMCERRERKADEFAGEITDKKELESLRTFFLNMATPLLLIKKDIGKSLENLEKSNQFKSEEWLNIKQWIEDLPLYDDEEYEFSKIDKETLKKNIERLKTLPSSRSEDFKILVENLELIHWAIEIWEGKAPKPASGSKKITNGILEILISLLDYHPAGIERYRLFTAQYRQRFSEGPI